MNNIKRIKLIMIASLLSLNCGPSLNAETMTSNTLEVNHQQVVSDTLSPRQQAILLIASYMASSQMEKLKTALNQGLDAGLTINETKEILVQLYAYTGFPRSLNALNELMNVVASRKQLGIIDAGGKEPITPVPVGDELKRVGIANQTKIAGAPVQGPLFEFAPVINQFLQTHLFGDIFARDNLDWQSRELATVGALAATPGVESQLLSHIRGSLCVGLTEKQLQQIVLVLHEHNEIDASARVNYALQQVTK
ncbi:carboxymuconolactone decarboxylase [Entomomonas moraniae]|uniref:Carboxymuconolactone decarboxylase n=1 Tax=Entomomonas moraniae TaxID=2213226 RepID=A0A3Q9JHY2_9GAMM|nr:carboxymuconolactone decarboxylase family protein [Entomomonas moraniae]AZS49901.1 carboxymuconolactone decarboxylase [Entomomonas moraniae]